MSFVRAVQMKPGRAAERHARQAEARNSKAGGAQDALQAALDASPRVVAQARRAQALSARVSAPRGPVDGAAPPEVAQLFQEERADAPVQAAGGEHAAAAPAESPRPNATGLPDGLKAGLEATSGLDLSSLRVHYNASEPAQLSALAYAQGDHIYLGPGQEEHLPHEGWHAVQQRQGRVPPTGRLAGQAVNDDSALEREADVMGGRAAQMRVASADAAGAVQRAPDARPGVALQRWPADRAPVATRAEVVQRQIYVADDLRDNPAVQAVQRSALYRALNASPLNVAIVRGEGSTDVAVRSDFNAAEFDAKVPAGLAAAHIQYVVTLNTGAVGADGIDVDAQRRLPAGAIARPAAPAPLAEFTPEQIREGRERAERARGGVGLLRSLPVEDRQRLYEYELLRDPLRRGIFSNPTSSLFLEDVDYVARLDPSLLAGIEPYYSSPVVSALPGLPAPEPALLGLDVDDLPPLIDEAEPAASTGRLSLYTVLLHELGHVRQQMGTRRAFNTGHVVAEVTEETRPPVPPGLQAQTETALKEGVLAAPVWRELLDLKNAMQKWLPVVRDFFADGGKGALADRASRADALGDRIAAHAQVWLEYDVITNVEHPVALERGEALRHLHGVEQTVTPGQGEQTLAALAARTTAASPTSLAALQQVMVDNAQRLTGDLPQILAEYLGLLDTLRAAVQNAGAE